MKCSKCGKFYERVLVVHGVQLCRQCCEKVKVPAIRQKVDYAIRRGMIAVAMLLVLAAIPASACEKVVK